MSAWQFIRGWFSNPVKKEEVPTPPTLSDKGMELLKQLEGVRLRMYRDSAGHPTIGIGHKLTSNELASGLVKIGDALVDWQDGITPEQAEILKRQDAALVEAEIRKLVLVPLTQNQFDALVCLVFNIGAGAFRRSTLLKKINQGKIQEAADEFSRWDKITMQNGEKIRLAALTKRRQREARLWLLA